jgi:hypothetical protein
LLGDRPVSASSTKFVLLMLSSVTFDGLLATPLWADVTGWMIHSQALRPLIIALQDVTGDAVAAVGTIALVLFLTGFQLLYLLFSALMRWCVPAAERAGLSLRQVAGLFVLSLVPIALAYHLAHYLSYLAIVGQYMIPLLSDPFGFGWNLFGTRLYVVDIGVVNARLVWYTSVIAIVAGHIVAVWLAHVTALRAFASNRAALRSQAPMLLLMVAYTMLSLWILAQPVVEAGCCRPLTRIQCCRAVDASSSDAWARLWADSRPPSMRAISSTRSCAPRRLVLTRVVSPSAFFSTWICWSANTATCAR